MKTIKLNAEPRATLGRKVKKLRTEGLVPGNIYGKKVKSLSIQLPESEFSKAYKQAGETGILELKVGKETRPVLIQNVQTHPVTDATLHVDLKQVNLKEKTTATVPVVLEGESPADKSGLGILVHLIDELEVTALPTDLPEQFSVNVSKLVNVDDFVTVGALKYDKAKVEVDAEEDKVLARIAALQKEEEPEPSPVDTEETGAEEEPSEETPTEESKDAPQESES